ncbi:MAG: hypothetical protein U1F30_10940 [Steroidobacteraceae bacterium]
MPHNPYAAPKSVVADIPAEGPPVARPKEVLLAFRLLWIMYGVGLLVVAAKRAWAISHQSAAILIATQAISLALSVWIYNRILAGKNWARMLLLFGAAFSVLVFAMPQTRALFLSAPALTRISAAVKAPVSLYVLWLLFVSPGRHWFRKPGPV